MTDEPLAAGPFAPWLSSMRRALRGEIDSDVACGGCTACCSAYQFVHVDVDETDAIAHIPGELLVQAPGRPAGHLVMGYDEHGRCPMLGERGCTIYEHRPRTCRMYDCRVFAATGIVPEGDEQADIRRRVERWRFDVTTEGDDVARDALHAAVECLRDHPDVLPDGRRITGATELAVVAVELQEHFIGHDDATGRSVVVSPPLETLRAELAG